MARTSEATATWTGALHEGKGRFEAASGAFAADYAVATRFGEAPGTNPEELLAAAHAACLSMALTAALDRAGTPPTTITTTAHCTIESTDGGAEVTMMRLVVRGDVPGIDATAFVEAAEQAKNNCPLSKALAGNVAMELDARLGT